MFRRFALVLGGVLLGALGAELALRTVYVIPEVADPLYSCHESDAVLGWHGRSNMRMRFHRDDFDVQIEHGPDGWRRPDPPPPAHPSRRVLFIGDSFTWGWGVAQGEVFSDRLQQRLPPDVAVSNRGVNGYATSQEYLLLQRELAEPAYDTVALLFFFNDVDDNVSPKRGRRPLFALEGDALVPLNQPPEPMMSATKRFIMDHSRAYQLGNIGVELFERWLHATFRDKPVAAGDINYRDLPGAPVTMRLLREMHRWVAAHGAQFVLVYVPYASEIEPGRPDYPLARAGHALLRDVAAQEEIPLIDLTDRFRAEAQRGQILVFAHDDHWTAAGHQVAAQALLDSPLFPWSADARASR